ncbi:uncharacterized protein LOC131033834 isoform X2 [Cryptomeria japonica]|uniref:uncharacterized protein LOC131033834 isoform X2 n=1 Tax=Cryptomeria japonica TaxID=3369 RepID=UPI0025ACD428|nr:uncharacterized protein LOC131033834 isoform X2 [Cryptomeria japonica]
MSKVQLELNIISAQDLKSRALFGEMQTYGVAWINPGNKLSTRIDPRGGSNPTWNDKVIFRVEEGFLHNETSSVTIEIYCIGCLKDRLVGTVRVMLYTLLKGYEGYGGTWRSFCALQVRLPSGRPQGILNLGAMILDVDQQLNGLSCFRRGALGYMDLMGKPQPRPNSFVDKLFFIKPKAKNSTDDVEQGIICLPCKKAKGQDFKENRFHGFKLKKRNKKKKCIGFCPCVLAARNMNGPAKIHLSPSDDILCCSCREDQDKTDLRYHMSYHHELCPRKGSTVLSQFLVGH